MLVPRGVDVEENNNDLKQKKRENSNCERMFLQLFQLHLGVPEFCCLTLW